MDTSQIVDVNKRINTVQLIGRNTIDFNQYVDPDEFINSIDNEHPVVDVKEVICTTDLPELGDFGLKFSKELSEDSGCAVFVGNYNGAGKFLYSNANPSDLSQKVIDGEKSVNMADGLMRDCKDLAEKNNISLTKGLPDNFKWDTIAYFSKSIEHFHTTRLGN